MIIKVDTMDLKTMYAIYHELGTYYNQKAKRYLTLDSRRCAYYIAQTDKCIRKLIIIRAKMIERGLL